MERQKQTPVGENGASLTTSRHVWAKEKILFLTELQLAYPRINVLPEMNPAMFRRLSHLAPPGSAFQPDRRAKQSLHLIVRVHSTNRPRITRSLPKAQTPRLCESPSPSHPRPRLGNRHRSYRRYQHVHAGRLARISAIRRGARFMGRLP